MRSFYQDRLGTNTGQALKKDTTVLDQEITRMLLVDIFVLRDYFSGRSYRIFRAPLPCGALAGLNNFDSSDDDVDLAMLPGGWCPDIGPAGPDARYFYGVGPEAFSPVRKTPLFAPFIYNTTNILPRQARDKHRKRDEKKRGVFCRTPPAAQRSAQTPP
jgi:hypothetical protein